MTTHNSGKSKRKFFKWQEDVTKPEKSGYAQCNSNINTKPLFTERDEPFDVLGFSHYWKSHGFQWRRLRK